MPLREKSWKGTHQRVEEYQGKSALLQTWEERSDEEQIRNHEYIIELRARVRAIRNYIMHRADPEADI